MEIDRAQNKALQKTSASDFERFWNRLPSTGYRSAVRTLSLATDLSSRVWLRPFCLPAIPHPFPCPRLLFPVESSLSLVTSTLSSLAIPPPPLPSAVRSAHEYQCTSWGASGTAWYLPRSPACSSSPIPASDCGEVTRFGSHRVCTVTPLFGENRWVWNWGEWAQSSAQPESRI